MPSPTTPQPADNVQYGLYEDADCVDDYEFDPGVCVLPLAEDPPTDPSRLAAWSPVAKFTVHAPYRLRRSRTSAKKQNNPPVVPAPADTGAFVFLGGTASFACALNISLSAFDWAVDTDYTFVENCNSRYLDGFVLTTQPWVWLTQYLNDAAGAPPPPAGTAVALAGVDAQVGYAQGQAARNNLNGAWGYNTPTFFPGSLMSTDLANGGSPYTILPDLIGTGGPT